MNVSYANKKVLIAVMTVLVLSMVIMCATVSHVQAASNQAIGNQAAGTNDHVFDIDKNGKLTGFHCGAIDEIDVIVPYGVKSSCLLCPPSFCKP